MKLNQLWNYPRIISAWNFIKIMRVEPVWFLMIFQYGLKLTPASQIVQDKICLQKYNTTIEYCHDLPSSDENDGEPGHYKTSILADTTQFGAYESYATIIPLIFWTLFLGSWIDRYAKARKIILVIFSIAAITENLISITLSICWNTSYKYNIMTDIPTSLSPAPSIAIMHYMTSQTPLELMAIRFMVFDILETFAVPIGQSLGGFILVKKPIFNTGEIRNYTMCFIVALIFELVGLAWIIFMVNEKTERLSDEQSSGDELNKEQSEMIEPKSKMNKQDEGIHPIKLLFNLENIKGMILIIIRKRPNKGRKQVIFLLMCLAILFSEIMGLMFIKSQFIQRVYRWGPDWASYMNSIGMVLGGISTMTIIPLLSKVLNVSDVRLSLIGFIITITTNIIKGSWLSPNAYYLAMVIGVIGGCASIGARSHLSKIVDKGELGKVMSLMSTLDTLASVIAITFFTVIFNKTIDNYPGAIHQFVAGLLLITLIIMMWIDLCTEKPVLEEKSHDMESDDQDQNRNVNQHPIIGDKVASTKLLHDFVQIPDDMVTSL